MKFIKKNIVPKLCAGILILLLVGHTVWDGLTQQAHAAFAISLPAYKQAESSKKGEAEPVSKPVTEQEETPNVPVVKYANDDTASENVPSEGLTDETGALTQLYGIDDLVFQPETDMESVESHEKIVITSEMLATLAGSSVDYIKKNFYTVDKRTDILPEQLDVQKFLSYDFTIDNTIAGPKVLIFHTHVYEGYTDSNPNDYTDGVIAVGDELKRILEKDYGIETLHHVNRYDMVDGKVNINGAYERVEPGIQKILKENPSIQVVIDMHRDGTLGTAKFATRLDGKDVAKIMFVNGLSQKNNAGKIEAITYLSNPNRESNLALSFQLQLLANENYPDFSRKVYLNAYRYSLHMLPKSILLEVGNQNNTKQEALNAMPYFASMLAGLITD